MILHCTQKLAAKLPSVSTTPLTHHNPLGDWHANLYVIDRRNCLMFCHDQTRFVLFMAGLKKGDFANLDFWFQDLYANTMLKLCKRGQIYLAGKLTSVNKSVPIDYLSLRKRKCERGAVTISALVPPYPVR